MSRFKEAFALTLTHWNNNGIGEPNNKFIESLDIDPDEFSEIFLAVYHDCADMADRSGAPHPVKVAANIFLAGLLVGQKMEALQAKVPDDPGGAE